MLLECSKPAWEEKLVFFGGGAFPFFPKVLGGSPGKKNLIFAFFGSFLCFFLPKKQKEKKIRVGFPVGALCFYQAHFGRTVLPEWPLWAHLLCSVFCSVSELRRACFRQARVAMRRASARRIFSCRGLSASSLCPQIPHAPAPKFVGFRFHSPYAMQELLRPLQRRWTGNWPCDILCLWKGVKRSHFPTVQVVSRQPPPAFLGAIPWKKLGGMSHQSREKTLPERRGAKVF